MQKANDPTIGLPSPAERRVRPRYRPSSVVYVKVGTENGGIVLNISESGLQLAAGEVLKWNAALSLSLKLSYHSDPIEAVGQLIWLSESKRTAGFEFVSLTDDVRTQIRDWISLEEDATVENSHPPKAAETIRFTDCQQSPELLALGPEEPASVVEWAALSQPVEEISPGGPLAKTSFAWFQIAMISIFCFAAGMVVGIAWVARSRAVGPPSASTAVSEPTGHDHRPGGESTSPISTSATTRNVASISQENPENFVEVTAPDEGAQPELVTLPQIAVSASDSVAIAVRQFVLVPPAPGPASERHPERLVGGRIAGPPLGPLPSGLVLDATGDVVRLRLSVDEQGGLNGVIPTEGRADLVSLAEDIVRRWVQTPSRLAGRPIASLEDVTVTFRPAP